MRFSIILSFMAACTLSAAQLLPPFDIADAPSSVALGGSFSLTLQQGHSGGISGGGQVVITLGESAAGPGVVLFSGAFDPTETLEGIVQTYELTVPAVESEGFSTGSNVLNCFLTAEFESSGGASAGFIDYYESASVGITVTSD